MANGNSNGENFLKKRLSEYINTARERTEIYRKDSKRYFQINLTLASALITTLTFFISFFNNPENLEILNFFIIIIIGASFSLIVVFLGVVYEFSGKDTDFRGFNRKTISFYKGNVPEDNKPDKLDEYYNDFESKFKTDDKKFITNKEILLEDDIRNLFILHYYAANYQKIAKNFRRLLKSEVLIILGSIIIQLTYCLFFVFGIEAFLIIIICFIIGVYVALIPFVKITTVGIYAVLNRIIKKDSKILGLLKNLLERFGVKDSQSHLYSSSNNDLNNDDRK